MRTRLLQISFISLILCFGTDPDLASQTLTPGISQGIYNDTVFLKKSDVESAFLSKNLLLLAQKYSIDEAKAQLLQAKLWNNPSLSYEINPYNPGTRRYFDISARGESVAGIDQLFNLAGKRNKKIALEKINAETAEFQFYDLLRTLKYQLRISFYNLYFFEQSARLFETEIKSCQKLVNQSDMQLKKGNVSMMENMRLKSELFDLQNEKMALLDSVNIAQSTIRIMMNDTTNRYFIPVLDTNLVSENRQDAYTIGEIQKLADENRFDLKMSQNQIRWSEANLSLNRAMASPDIGLHASYDHQSNYITDYFGIGFSIDLPFFNRNQGNIRSSESKLEESRADYENFHLQLLNSVLTTYSKLVRSRELFDRIDPDFMSGLKKISDGLLDNYEKRSVSILEFIDFFESYRQTVLTYDHLKNNLLDEYEEMNFITGTDLFNK